MREADNLPPYCAVVKKSRSLNFLDPSGPARPVTGLLYLSFLLKYRVSRKSVQWKPNCSMRTDGRADKQDEANSSFSQFCERTQKRNMRMCAGFACLRTRTRQVAGSGERGNETSDKTQGAEFPYRMDYAPLSWLDQWCVDFSNI